MYKPSSHTKFFYEKNSIFLFNSLSRACIKIEKDELEKIKEVLEKEEPCLIEDKKIQNILIKNRFIIFKDVDEIKSLEFLYNSKYFLSDQILIALVPSLKCNFKCPYCFEKRCKDKVIENENYFKILRKFVDSNFCNKKSVHVSLFGGEPLLKKKQMFSYLKYLLNQSKKCVYKLSTNIVTNGFLLNEKIT